MRKQCRRYISFLIAMLLIVGMFGAITASAAEAEFAPSAMNELVSYHSISLHGNIELNFYLDPDLVTAGKTVNFTWDLGSYSYTLRTSDYVEGYGYKVPVSLPAAEMTYKLHASVNGVSATDDYSVRDYCDVILNPHSSFSTNYAKNYGATNYADLVGLVKTMLDYGAKAQYAFDVKTGDLANAGISYSMDTNVTAQMFDNAIAAANGDLTADDMNVVATALGGEYKTTSLFFLSENILRHYFKNISPDYAWSGNQDHFYYFIDSDEIAAAELDDLQSFTLGDTTFRYSALDYFKALVTGSTVDVYRDLAKASYWYNQAANTYFDHFIDLGALTADSEAMDGDVLSGTLAGDYQITVADGAFITLMNADITCLSDVAGYAGITPLGDATINLVGTNVVKGGENNPGIYAPENKTLTIEGSGSLTASSDGNGCGIGVGDQKNAGDIVINGGTINATGGDTAAGIGSAEYLSCGSITINGGTVTAKGGVLGAGIGSGLTGGCGNITICGGTVIAIGGDGGAGIGSGVDNAGCGDITITDGVDQVTATRGGSSSPNSIGSGFLSSCGTVTVGDTDYTSGLPVSPFSYVPGA